MFDIKGLITALLRPRKSDAVSDLTSATQMMAGLADRDIGSAHRAIIKSLQELNQNSRLSSKERLRTLQYIDEKAQPLQLGLVRECLRQLDREPQQIKSQVDLLRAYWTALADGYRLVLRDYQRKPNRALQDAIPMATARALSAFAELGKWSLLQYHPVGQRVWRNLDRLYLFAEEHRFARTPMVLHVGAPAISCEDVLLRMHLLHLAQPEGLSARQIDALDQWLMRQTKLVQLDRDIKPHRQVYAINLEAHRPAHRLRRNMIAAGYRYINTQPLLEALEQTQSELEMGEVPAQLGLGEHFQRNRDEPGLQRAMACWSRDQYPSRRFERNNRQQGVEILIGLNAILNSLSGEPAAAGSSLRQPVELEVLQRRGISGPRALQSDIELQTSPDWQLEDESIRGFGIMTEQEHAVQIHMQDLIGLQRGEQLMVGVVRRISNDQKLKLGIELLATQFRQVTLQQGNRQVTALYFPDNAELSLKRALVLPAGALDDRHPCQMLAGNQHYEIELTSPTLGDHSYQCAGFRVLAKQAA